MAIPNISNLPISASFQQILQISGSVIGTATGSQVDELTITASLATTAEVATSSSYSDTAISASHAVQADSALAANTATSASHALNADDAISSSYAITASHALNVIDQVDTGSLLTTASISDATITFTKGDASTFAITANNVVSASYAATASVLLGLVVSASHAVNADTAIEATHADRVEIPARAAEALSKGDPVYVSGYNNGQERIEISKADAGDSNKMPVVGLVIEDVSQNTNTHVITNGSLEDVDTDDFNIGDILYVAVGSANGLTNVKPTGSALIQNVGKVGRSNQNNGEILVASIQRSNDVPNITENYLWVGNSDQVATPTDKDALTVGTASLALDVISTANLNIATISASSANFQSASIGYLESVTGSAKIIGDAFIILNNNLPAERYAGIVVQDSGSGAPNTTASFEWDGQTNDWFYHYEGDDPTDYSIAMFGPEYTTKGSPVYLTNNTIPKGDGGHHLNDSNITDDGSKIVLGSDSEVTGSLGVTGGITGSLSGQATTAVSASHAVQADSSLTANTATTATDATNAANVDLSPDGTNTNRYVPFTATDNGNGALLTDPGILYNPSTNVLTATTFNGNLTGNASTATTATTASYVAGSNVDGVVASATSASHALNADDAISSSYATSASIADYEKNLNSSSGSIQLWQGSKTEYDAISGSASNDVLYFVIE